MRKNTVTKRDGRRESVQLEKISRRVESLSEGLDVDVMRIVKSVVQGLHDGVQTSKLDDVAAETAAFLNTHHVDYGILAGRIEASNLQKNTSASMRAIMPHMSDDVRAVCEEHLDSVDRYLCFERDYRYDYLGMKTLQKSYLMRDKMGTIIERPQMMWMRVALGIHGDDMKRVFETYDLMSSGFFTHATPTLFNAGTPNPCLASCFLLPIEDDSISGMYNSVRQCAIISKGAGGIGLSVSNVRGSGSHISSTKGTSSGIVPMLRVFNNTARHVDQGGGKRPGSFAVYLEPWHCDVENFLELKKNNGAEEMRARDLFYALWIPDIFMRRVQADEEWTLLCPSTCPDLVTLYGDDFDRAYEVYEKTVPRRTVRAQVLWAAIIDSQIETGTPYMLYKDACNYKSNQKNVGTIRSSNLCTEIVQYSDPNETAVCNLASISLPSCVTSDGSAFDHRQLARVVHVIVRNLNRVIDKNMYPSQSAQRSNQRHRPVGIGMQGLADVFAMLELPFCSDEARRLNQDISETIYYASLQQSCELAKQEGAYETFKGSPASQGLLQFDLWGVTPSSGRWDWAKLKRDIVNIGLRNSLLVAPMPTASTAQILGNNECFEPFTTNMYTRTVGAGSFMLVNKHMVRHLQKLGLWTESNRQAIIASNGSLQSVPGIPEKTKELFKTVWEMKMKPLLDMAADRGAFVDQSQSLNLFLRDPTHSKLTSMHFYGWKKGLKTGMYYLRTCPAAEAVKVTLDPSLCQEGACESCSA